MSRRLFVSWTLALFTGLVLLAVPASAHEGREIGDMEVVVGLTPEPAVANNTMQIQVFLREHPSEKPIVLTEAQLKGLAAHLFVGKLAATPQDQDYDRFPNRPMPLQPAFDSPGEYVSQEPFIPTGPVTVTIHLATKENVKIHGQSFNEIFVSGPDTFGPIQDSKKLMIPGSPPSPAELQAKDVATDQVLATDQDTDRTTAIVLGAGVLVALILGSLAVFRTRRQPTQLRTPVYAHEHEDVS